jgi:hypothetical protein
MKKYFDLLILAVTIFSLIGCDASNKDEYKEQIVVQGMMYVGQPLRVRLTRTLPMGQTYDAAETGVSGADVHVSAATDTFQLVEQATDANGGGYYMVEDTTVEAAAGAEYAIHVEVGQHILDASTVGAGSTDIEFQNADTVEYGDPNNFLVLRWQRDSLAAGYAALIENLEPDWYEDYRAVSGNNGPDLVPWNIWTIPATDDSLKLPWIALGFTGRHRVRLLTCDRNLWNYMWTYVPGDAEENPVSNVRGGLGIFSVGGVDTTYFMLTDTISDGPNGI